MPLSTNPNKTIWFPLDCDRELPADARPEFQCRFISGAQSDQIDELIDQAATQQDDRDAHRIITDAILIGVVGWRNMTGRDANPIEFSRESLHKVLTLNEKFELAGKQKTETSLQEFELKKSQRQSSSPTEKAAGTTDAASA